MAIVIGAYFIGFPILAILSLPVFISAMMGINFSRPKKVARITSGHTVRSKNTQHQTAH